MAKVEPELRAIHDTAYVAEKAMAKVLLGAFVTLERSLDMGLLVRGLKAGRVGWARRALVRARVKRALAPVDAIKRDIFMLGGEEGADSLNEDLYTLVKQRAK